MPYCSTCGKMFDETHIVRTDDIKLINDPKPPANAFGTNEHKIICSRPGFLHFRVLDGMHAGEEKLIAFEMATYW